MKGDKYSRNRCSIGLMVDEPLVILHLRAKVNTGLNFAGSDDVVCDAQIRAFESVRQESPFGLGPKYGSSFSESGSQTVPRVGVVYEDDVITLFTPL